jgi:hypothetical protein
MLRSRDGSQVWSSSLNLRLSVDIHSLFLSVLSYDAVIHIQRNLPRIQNITIKLILSWNKPNALIRERRPYLNLRKHGVIILIFSS